MRKNETEISQFWGRLRFFCEGCKADDSTPLAEMKAEVMLGIPFYVCPNCGMKHSFYVLEKDMRRISDLLVNAAEEEEDLNLKNYRWHVTNSKTSLTAYYHVLSHKDEKLKIGLRISKKGEK